MASTNLTVTLNYPENGATNIPLDSVIKVYFSKDLKASTVSGNCYLQKVVDNIATNVDGTTSYEAKCLSFTPAAKLDTNSHYRFVVLGDNNISDNIASGVQDIFGNTMLYNYTILFTTQTVNLLAATTINAPIDNTYLSAAPTITWTAVTGATAYNVQVATISDFSTILWQTTTANTSVDTGLTLSEEVYFVRVKYSTASGTSGWSNVVRFYYTESVGNGTDTNSADTYLMVVGSTPTNSSENNLSSTSITVTFNKNIDVTSINSTNLSITKDKTEVVSYTVTSTDKVLSIAATLEDNSTYTIVLGSTITAEDDDTMYEPVQIEFTTTYSPMYAKFIDVYYDLLPIISDIPQTMIYRAIRDASIYVQGLVNLYTNSDVSAVIDNKDFNNINWDDIDTIPSYIQMYVRYQAGLDAFKNYLQVLGAGTGSVTLSDFSIDTGNSGVQGVQLILKQLEAKVKPWLDRIMGFGLGRGYATLNSATKGGTSYSTPSWMNRTW